LIAEYLSGEINPDALNRGMELLKEYGIDSDSVYSITSFSRSLNIIPFLCGLFACLAGFWVLFFAALFLSKLFSRVDSVSAMAAAAAEGKYWIDPAGERFPFLKLSLMP
jgi:hypothetical protein